MVFHPAFDAVTDYSYSSIIPAFSSPLAIHLFKWTLSSLFILPNRSCWA